MHRDLKNIAKVNIIIHLSLLTAGLILQVLALEGMYHYLVYSAILSQVVIVLSFFAKKKVHSLLSCLFAFNIAPIWFLYLETILSGYDAYEFSRKSTILEMLLWTFTFQILTNFTYFLLSPHLSKRSFSSFSFINSITISSKIFRKIVYIFFIIPLIAFLIYYGSIDGLWFALSAGRSGGGGSGLLIRSAKGDGNFYMMFFSWMWQLVPMITGIALFSDKRNNRGIKYLVLLPSILVVIVYFLGGSRSYLVLSLSPLAFFYLYFNINKGVVFWSKFILFLILVIGAMQLQYLYRGNFLSINNKAELINSTSINITKTHRDNNSYLFCLLIDKIPRRYRFEGFNEYIATLLNPIPRSLWSKKPVLKGARDFKYKDQYLNEGSVYIGTNSLSISIVGEAYRSMHIFGIIIYALTFGIIISYFEGFYYLRIGASLLAIGVHGSFIFLSFWGYRSLFALVSFIYPTLILLVLIIIWNKFFQKRRKFYSYNR